MEPERLAAIPFFAGLPEAELAEIAAVASELELESGHVIANEGDLGHAVFVIEEGTADVVTDGTTVARAGPGDVVGEVAVLRSGRRTASVTAATPMRVLALFKRDVWALERRAPEAAGKLRALLDERPGQRGG